MKPSSGPRSLAAAAMSLMAVEISVALLPSSNPKMWGVLPALVPFHHFSQLHFEQDGEATAIALGQDILHAHASSLALQSVHLLILGIQDDDMFLSQVSISSLFLPKISHFESLSDLVQGSPRD